MPGRFEKHARTVTLLTLLSRVTGLARDAALARVFGISATIDAFWFAFMIPNLFRRLFGEGALSAAFLPEYSRLDKENPDVARHLACRLIASLIFFLGGITLAGELALYAMLPAADESESHLALKLMMIMLPYMPMVCLVAIIGSMLQVHGRFGPTAAAPIVLNLCIVAAACGFAASELAHISIVAVSVIVAGVLQLVWSLLALRRWGALRQPALTSTIAPTDSQVGASMKRVLKQSLPMVIGLGVLQLNVFLD